MVGFTSSSRALPLAALVAIGCSSKVEIIVESDLRLPAQADRLLVEATLSDSESISRNFAISSNPTRFEIDFQSTRPSELPLTIKLNLGGDVVAETSVALFDLENSECFNVFIPGSVLDGSAFVHPCGRSNDRRSGEPPSFSGPIDFPHTTLKHRLRPKAASMSSASVNSIPRQEV